MEGKEHGNGRAVPVAPLAGKSTYFRWPAGGAFRLLLTFVARPAHKAGGVPFSVGTYACVFFAYMNTELKQDFETALVRHLLFKSKLRSYLYGSNIAEEPIRNAQACAFGRWITERAFGPYKHLPEVPELDRLHQQIHQIANRLMDLHLQKQSEQAIAGLPAVYAIADQITLLLRTMEGRLQEAV